MYGQLKSTVQCLTCNNVSITFDPFLTVALPIAKPFKLIVGYIPYNMFNESGERNKVQVFTLPLDKNSKVSDIHKRVNELTGTE